MPKAYTDILPSIQTFRVVAVLFCCATIAAPSIADSDAHQKLVEEMLKVMHVDELWPQMVDAMMQSRDFANPQEREEFHRMLSGVDGTALMRDVYTKIYFKYFTEDEMRQMIEFYKTPLGQKTVTTMPKLTADIMTEERQAIMPKIMAVAQQISEERESRRRTEQDLRDIGTALEAWALSGGTGYPERTDMPALAAKLKSVAPNLAVNDAWGHPYAYAVSSDRKHYRVVSAGSDGTFESDSLKVTADVPAETQYTDSLAKDIIYADGRFVQMPKEWHP